MSIMVDRAFGLFTLQLLVFDVLSSVVTFSSGFQR